MNLANSLVGWWTIDMKILLTGASSFTGSWFALALAQAGHRVTATFRNSADSYADTRGERVSRILDEVEPVWGVEFGDDRFFDAIGERSFDLICHHAAEMTDYRSWDFDVLSATAKNTRGARRLLTALAEKGGGRLVLTGSVFEPYEGVGDADARAFNPYGLSKHLSFEVFRLEAERLGLALGKFIIPNPFGPYEEPRFTAHLMKEWAAGRTPTVQTPVYVRDNIHVSLLALAYRNFCQSLKDVPGVSWAKPSGFIESQGAFAWRVAREVAPRTGWACEVKEVDQRDFPEPLIRTNTELAAQTVPEWSESAAWDAMASYYQARL